MRTGDATRGRTFVACAETNDSGHTSRASDHCVLEPPLLSASAGILKRRTISLDLLVALVVHGVYCILANVVKWLKLCGAATIDKPTALGQCCSAVLVRSSVICVRAAIGRPPDRPVSINGLQMGGVGCRIVVQRDHKLDDIVPLSVAGPASGVTATARVFHCCPLYKHD